MGSLIINFMGGRYGKYGEIKRLARLRKRNIGLPFWARSGKDPLERRRHGKGHPRRQGPKGSHVFVVDGNNDQGASR